MLSHPEFHKNNFDSIIKILLDNGYLLNLIFSIIKQRLFFRFNYQKQKKNSLINNTHISPREIYFTIPYISFIAKKFIQYFKNISFCKLAFTCLNRFIKVYKDSLPAASRLNVVYKINCHDCEASYVEQTKRILNTWISEHRNHIRRSSPQASVRSSLSSTIALIITMNSIGTMLRC